MNADLLKDTFFSLVFPDIPNDWDVEEAIESLVEIDEEKCRSALKQVPVIWPVSHSLCFDYLKRVASALDCFEQESLSQWVISTLDQYEKNGLRAAQRYMADVERNFLCPLRGEDGISFKQVHGMLLPYLRGLSNKPLHLESHELVYTDTSTVHVPYQIGLFDNNDDNIFMYKLIVSYQWAFIAGSSFMIKDFSQIGEMADDEELTEPLWLQKFLGSFADRQVSADLYHLLETIRITAFLEDELPGLMRRKKELLHAGKRCDVFLETGQGIFQYLQNSFIHGHSGLPTENISGKIIDQVHRHRANASSAMDSANLTGLLYESVKDALSDSQSYGPVLYQGAMRLDAVHYARNKRLEQTRDLFIDALASRILQQPRQKNSELKEHEHEEKGTAGGTEKPTLAMIVESSRNNLSTNSDSTEIVTLDNEQIEFDSELQGLADSIVNDLGYLPEQYLSSAAGRAGKGYAAFRGGGSDKGTEVRSSITYDEWDYRRRDFRKNWCSLLEKEMPLTSSNFYQATLDRYHGQIVRLRYQFEMMRTRERFVGRQRDGDDIDLDALIESVSDARAGLPPSDRLFVRLKRDERDIAVCFLIDMSNSTQGWIGDAIKESIVLLSEALEVVGDRYAIYGFSGMRRLRSEFFHIKHFDEQYDDTVKSRISSIGPREYTRMGPAIRHATTLLEKIDSRVRILVTLSDGKPEDYDDYKGEYAIEDTRHALIETKVAGIHPFCITIDRHAQDYISHMYGSVNYIQIDDVKKLPHRLPEIYRVLTS